MKKIFLILLIVLLSFINVKAASFDMDCGNSSVSLNEEISIPVYVNRDTNDDNINYMEGMFSYDTSKLSFNGYDFSLSNWNNNYSENTFSFEALSASDIIQSERVLVFNARFTIISQDDSNIDLSIINPIMKNSDGEEISNVTGSSCTYLIRSDSNDLTKLKIYGIDDLTPEFNKDILSYRAKTNSYNIYNIDYETSPSATVECEMNGKQYDCKSSSPSLDVGDNTLKINVISSSGKKKTYVIVIDHHIPKSSECYLTDLQISPGLINFDYKVLEYRVTVNSDVETMYINPKGSYKAKVELNGPEKLSFGENVYTITVTSQDKSQKKVYKLYVIRKKDKTELSDVAELSSLKIDGYNINFNPKVYEYNIKSSETEFKITAKAKNNGTVYIFDDGKLNDDNNLIVRVTAEDGSINDYIIHVKQVSGFNLILLLIIIGVLLITFGSIALVMIKSKKKNKQKEEVVEQLEEEPKEEIEQLEEAVEEQKKDE